MKRLLMIVLAFSSPTAMATEPTAQELLQATDDLMRGTSSSAAMEMHVKTSRYERTMRMTVLSEGTENTLIRILAPEREEGTTTLKVGENIWNYLPKTDRTIRIPAGMMGSSWMGSHFDNNDLVAEARLSEDYDATVESAADGWTLSLIPHEDTPVVWGRVELDVGADRLPREQRYYEEDGTLARTMTWGDVLEMDGRQVPTTMTLVPADEPEEFTRLTYTELDFDVEIPRGTFSQQSLRQ